MLKLVISDDEGKTTVVPLVRDEITIGRKEGNTIRLTERNVSRRHARISKRNDGFVLEDLASYNGIVLNGARLQEARSVKHGDQVLIGDYKLQIVDEPGAQTAPAPPAPPPPSPELAPLLAAPTPPPAPAGSAPAAPGAAALNNPFAAPQQSPVPENIKGLRIVFLAPAGVPPPVTLERLPMVMGRSEAADIALPFSSISREHARLFLDDGKLCIEDMGSSNGISVNEKKAPGKVELSPGDMVQLGVVEFRVARRGDSTVVIQRAAAEEKAAATRPNNKLIGGIIGGGVVLGLAVLAIAKMGGSTPSPTNPEVAPAAATAPATPAAQPEATPPAAAAPAPAAEPAPTPAPAAEPAPAPAAAPAQAAAPEPAPTPTPEPAAAPEPPAPNVQTVNTAPDRHRDRHGATATHQAAPAPAPTPRAAPAPAPTPAPAAAPAARPAPAAATGGGGTGWEGAMACRENTSSVPDQNACIIRALRGHTGSERELGLYASTLRSSGQRAQALTAMRQYVRQYPNGPQAANFLRLIAASEE